MKTGIVCALFSEAACFRPRNLSEKLPAQQLVELNDRTLLVVSGMGRGRARQAAHKLAEAQVDCLISFGSAGALAPTLRPGELILAHETMEGETRYTVDAAAAIAARERLSQNEIVVHRGALACAAEPVTTREAKLKLFEQTGAIAVDMETAGVFETAARNDVAAFALRVIIDPAHMTLPDIVLSRVNDFGKVNIPGLGLDLMRAPGQIPAVARLGCAARRTDKTMKQVAELLAHL